MEYFEFIIDWSLIQRYHRNFFGKNYENSNPEILQKPIIKRPFLYITNGTIVTFILMSILCLYFIRLFNLRKLQKQKLIRRISTLHSDVFEEKQGRYGDFVYRMHSRIETIRERESQGEE